MGRGIVFRRRRREGAIIATSTTEPGIGIESLAAGAVPGPGTYFCSLCNAQLSLRDNDQLPECPRCSGGEYRRDSIFEAMQEHGVTAEIAVPDALTTPEWLPRARAKLADAGCYLAFCEGEKIQVFPVKQGWTRIGRSANADIRLDDPSVSRRHALIVSERPDALRVLDDRSLNGVFLNGKIIEWGRLRDGDELAIGRYRLIALER